jgi:hypothetical protein
MGGWNGEGIDWQRSASSEDFRNGRHRCGATEEEPPNGTAGTHRLAQQTPNRVRRIRLLLVIDVVGHGFRRTLPQGAAGREAWTERPDRRCVVGLLGRGRLGPAGGGWRVWGVRQHLRDQRARDWPRASASRCRRSAAAAGSRRRTATSPRSARRPAYFSRDCWRRTARGKGERGRPFSPVGSLRRF